MKYTVRTRRLGWIFALAADRRESGPGSDTFASAEQRLPEQSCGSAGVFEDIAATFRDQIVAQGQPLIAPEESEPRDYRGPFVARELSALLRRRNAGYRFDEGAVGREE